MVNNLGTFYSNQSKLAKVEVIYIRVLESKKKTLGLDHISILDTINNLGIFYSE
jgi:hypothetical protein